ncbi:MAG: outer membrane beta-barrel protein [Chitinophagaceae bacterium]|nr:outer membrane beta-barrel protein [Chitinophagaceae bacterium]MCW5929612.1 outer membrane beta-barrel protein [Chitinophagaceae bacterium]
MRKLIVLLVLAVACLGVNGQVADGVVQEGEFGVTLGAAHYFGDLNTRAALNRPKPAVGVFFRKQFGEYIAVRLGLHYAQVGYSDIYGSNEFQKRRNLSFNSNIWEATIQGDFNFMRFVPGEPGFGFTPYVTLGIGAFNYDPYAYLGGRKYYLRPLATEGQGSAAYPGSRQYSAVALCLPLGMGVKYNVAPNINLSLEVAYRFTNTDYLDDVSSYYAPDAFPQTIPGDPNNTPSTWYLLQDRSYETGDGIRIGTKGRQRGFNKQLDAYVIAEVGIAFTLTSYRCPTVKY